MGTHNAPAYVIFLAGLFGMGSAAFLANQGIKLASTWKLPGSITRQQARHLDRIDPKDVRLGGNASVVITILASALLIVAGLYGISQYTRWHNDLEGTYIDIGSAGVNVEEKSNNTILGMHIINLNKGNINIEGLVENHRFEHPRQILIREEEDAYFNILDKNTKTPVSTGSNMYPSTGSISSIGWSTLIDNLTPEQWAEFKKHQIKIYLMLHAKYIVGGYVKISDSCFFFQSEDFRESQIGSGSWPAHGCIGHHRWYWQD